MMRAVAIFALSMLAASLIVQPDAKPLPRPQIVLGSCEFVRVKDADTYEVKVSRIITVRAADCWAPETKRTRHPSEKQLGLAAKATLETLVAPGAVCRLEVRPDGDEYAGDGLTFSRVVGRVYLEDGDGRNLGELMNATGQTFATKRELEAMLDHADQGISPDEM